MTLPTPGTPAAPNYWQYETGGELRPAIMRFLQGEALTIRDVALIRAYLRQWIDSPAWDMGPAEPESRSELGSLRFTVRHIQTPAGISEWLKRALDLGIDPL